MAEVKGYLLRTRLSDNVKREFYYQGTASAPDTSLAMNTIVALDASEARVFTNYGEASHLCSMLNADPQLTQHGYARFEIVTKSSRSMGISSPCDLSHHRTCRSAYGGSIINNTLLPY